MMGSDQGNCWVQSELEAANFGDSRLTGRAIKILRGLSENPNSSIPESIDEWAELQGTYRFFNNDKVSGEKILKAHYAATLERCSREKVVLVAHDTSSLNYSGLEKTQGLGDVGDSKNNPNAQGLIMHTAYAVTPERVALGILDQNLWARKTSPFKDSVKRMKAPIHRKESNKWLSSIQAVAKQIAAAQWQATKFIHLMDREADIYELLSEATDLKQDFIIRAKSNRRINKQSRASEDGILMFEGLAKSKPLGRVRLEIPTKNFLEGKREALVEVRAQEISLTAPRGKSIKDHQFKDQPITLTVIAVNELPSPDTDEEDLVNWMLLTNAAIDSAEQVLICLDYYCCRWQIEVFHRTLKTGCAVEKCRFSDAKKIIAYAAMMSIVAWRLHWMSFIARTAPNGAVDAVFTKQEQIVLSMLVLKKKPMRSNKFIDYFMLLARLGGFLARKGDGMPGAEVLWRGWRRLKEAINTMNALSQLDIRTYV